MIGEKRMFAKLWDLGYPVQDVPSNGVLIQAIIDTLNGSHRADRISFSPFWFSRVEAVSKRRFSSDCLSSCPQNFFFFFQNLCIVTNYTNKIFFFSLNYVFLEFLILLSGASRSCAGICLLNSQQSRNLKQVLCYSTACWVVNLSSV